MSIPVGTVRIKWSCSKLLRDNQDRIAVLFSANLRESSDADFVTEGFTFFNVHPTLPISSERTFSADYISRLQKYVDEICREGCITHGGEDSSYDSDYEAEGAQHQDVSRQTSDTLAAEYADYVQTDATPGYTARVEFALKLGYTERLVQAALQKLGPSPTQNELLAELIKLGSQRGCESSCDNSPTEAIAANLAGSEGADTSIVGGCLRPIVIDGSNVAMSHGNKEIFSCRGIKICVDWFRARGHKDITVFVPKWRKESARPDNLVHDADILAELERDRLLVFTPSRFVGGKRTVCYDDRYILKLAAELDGIVVSNDNYRDLCQESSEFRRVVDERVLMYSFVNDRFMPPDDPLGRAGPTLDNFLRAQPKKADQPPPCPYGKKCTYGNKCKYHHPERGPFPHKSVTERLSEHAQRHLQLRSEQGGVSSGVGPKTPLGRTRSNAQGLQTLKTDLLAPPHVSVSKSRSVDNVGGAVYASTSPIGSENLHKKLQRQLTLNPGSDPRLGLGLIVGRQPQSPAQQSVGTIGQPLSPIGSGAHSTGGGMHFLPPPPQGTTWDPITHQHVTRIASAPESYRAWPPQIATTPTSSGAPVGGGRPHMQRTSSCSEPQLNVWPPPAPASSHWPPPTVQLPTAHMQEEARRKMHYHLAAIFPEEQVTQVMQIYPDESDPQKICAAILTMFNH